MCMESEKAINTDFNISTNVATSVLELAEIIWKKLNPDLPFEYVSDKPYRYDVQRRIPNTNKAKDILGFEHKISLEESIDEVIEYMRSKN